MVCQRVSRFSRGRLNTPLTSYTDIVIVCILLEFWIVTVFGKHSERLETCLNYSFTTASIKILFSMSQRSYKLGKSAIFWAVTYWSVAARDAHNPHHHLPHSLHLVRALLPSSRPYVTHANSHLHYGSSTIAILLAGCSVVVPRLNHNWQCDFVYILRSSLDQ